MGKDQEVPEHFGMLHSKNLTPHRAIWTLAIISAVVGVITVVVFFGDGWLVPRRLGHSGIAPYGLWSSSGDTHGFEADGDELAEQSLVSFVDVLNGNEFHLGGDVTCLPP